jgi:ABC-type branched-subunit amino acid transport system ATPase component
MSVLALELKGLRSGYGEAMIVLGVELTIQPGEIFVLLGKNGMGKSTLLKTIMGFLPVAAGSVKCFGEDITGVQPHRIARMSVAYTPQEQTLFQDLTVEENLRLALSNDALMKPGLERIGAYFPFVPQRLKQRAGTLSGGEQKMLLVARALMTKPKLILVDEITEGLQPSVIERLASVFKAEREQSHTAILLIEQHVKFALAVADRYAVLKLGEIADQGEVNEPGVQNRIASQLTV